jgi:DNA-binding response OmpR family regulator
VILEGSMIESQLNFCFLDNGKCIKEIDQEVKTAFLPDKKKQHEIHKGLALGADPYLTKPFYTKDLVYSKSINQQ